VASITRQLRMNLNISANNATITRSNNPTDVAVGQHLIDTPDVTVTAGAIYSTPIRNDLIFTGILDYAYTGHSYGSYQPGSPNYNNPAYSVLNLSLSLSRGPLQATLYVKNVLGDTTIIQSPQINTVIEGYTVHPRVVGLTTKVAF
jgi:hypothetical protein